MQVHFGGSFTTLFLVLWSFVGEKERPVGVSLFYCVKEILVTEIFHEQRKTIYDAILYRITSPEICIADKWTKGLLLLVVSTVNTLCFSVLFSEQQPSSVEGTRFQSDLPLGHGGWAASRHLLSEPVLGGTFLMRLNIEFIHPTWVFPLCFDVLFFFFHEETRQFNTEFVFWWHFFLVMPAYFLERRVFNMTSYFITILFKLTGVQAIMLLLPICLII